MRSRRRLIPRVVARIAWAGCVLTAGCSREASAPPIKVLPADAGQQPKLIKSIVPPICNHDTPIGKWDVPIVNDTGRAVRFEYVRHTCSCQQSDIDSMTLEPGATTVLHMTADLRHRTGKQKFQSYLKEVGGGEWSCELDTVVFARTQFEPVAPLMFGMLEAGQQAEKTVTLCVYGRSEQDLPSSVEFNLLGGQATIVERPEAVTEPAADGILMRKFPLRVRLSAPRDAGPGEVTLNAHFLLHGEKVEARSSGGWQLRPTLTLNPPQAFWPKLPAAGTPESLKPVIIRRGDGKPFTVRRVDGADEAVECVVEEPDKAATLKVLRVRLDRARLVPPVWREVTVHVAGESDESIKLLVVVAGGDGAGSEVKISPK